MKLLFLGKKDNRGALEAYRWLQSRAGLEVTAFWGTRGDALPAGAEAWEGDYLLSYLSPWIVPEAWLGRARRAAINFHPGPPEYPGIGCTNFALYDEATQFGVTCHHMSRVPDTGSLIAVRRFPVGADDTVLSLTERCYEALQALFFEVMHGLFETGRLPMCPEHWRRRPYRRRELDALCALSLDMPEREIRRRVRAVTFPGMPGAYFVVEGQRFLVRPESSADPADPKPGDR